MICAALKKLIFVFITVKKKLKILFQKRMSWLNHDFLQKNIKQKIKKVLTGNRYQVSKLMRLDQVIHKMSVSKHLSENDVAVIASKSTNFLRNATFLSMLMKKTPACYFGFLDALCATHQHNLVDLLLTGISEVPPKPWPLLEGKKNTGYLGNYETHDGPIKMLLKNSTLELYHQTKEDSYDLISLHRGNVCIVSLLSGETQLTLSQRRDVSNFKSLFCALGYRCSTSEKHCFADMKERVHSFANNPIHKTSASCVLVSLFYDEKRFSPTVEEDLLSMFDNYRCKALRNKPKLFIFGFLDNETNFMSPDSFCRISKTVTFCDDTTSSILNKNIPTSSDFMVIRLSLTGMS